MNYSNEGVINKRTLTSKIKDVQNVKEHLDKISILYGRQCRNESCRCKKSPDKMGMQESIVPVKLLHLLNNFYITGSTITTYPTEISTLQL